MELYIYNYDFLFKSHGKEINLRLIYLAQI